LPVTASASGREPTSAKPDLRASVERVAAAESHRLDVGRAKPSASQSGQQSDPQLERGSFFKTPVGIAVLATLGVGVGYALYSSQNDRIRSTGR
jgi:hypothetical protein